MSELKAEAVRLGLSDDYISKKFGNRSRKATYVKALESVQNLHNDGSSGADAVPWEEIKYLSTLVTAVVK